METKQKTVTIEIPEGKKAVWNEQGILQLVDDDKKTNEPKPVTERIKTFYDAVCELAERAGLGDCEAKQLIEEYKLPHLGGDKYRPVGIPKAPHHHSSTE